MKRPQAPVLPAVHTLNLPRLEAPTAVPGALYGVREKGRPESLVSGLRLPDSWRGSTKHCEVLGLQLGRGVSSSSVKCFSSHAIERESLKQILETGPLVSENAGVAV